MINLRYFARMQDVTGKEEEQISLEAATVLDVLNWLKMSYPSFPYEAGSVLIAVNEEYAHLQDVVHSGDTVAIIPPVSGG